MYTFLVVKSMFNERTCSERNNEPTIVIDPRYNKNQSWDVYFL